MAITDQQSASEIVHASLFFERFVPAAIDQVFAAFADPDARSEWGAPSDTAVLIYDKTDFREGGTERFRCGSKTNPDIHGTTCYLSIIPNRRIVSTETIDVKGQRLCASLISLELSDHAGNTRLRLTSQIASFTGSDMIKGHEIGNNASLDNLCRYFEQA